MSVYEQPLNYLYIYVCVCVCVYFAWVNFVVFQLCLNKSVKNSLEIKDSWSDMFLLSFPPDICPSTQPANLCLSTLSLSVHTFTYLPFLPSSYPTLSDFLLPCSLYKSKKIKDSLVICSSLGIILIPDFHHVSLVFLVSLCCATASHKVTFPSSPEERTLYQSIWQTDGCMDVGRV